ncbi:Adiponectin receptor protein [Strongyloides ratti]|uniref:Adiponectin receptor protein n=1 Tax=Strongyloides ratti TaxID=34506 RepID=A0A090KWI2_STRRB|nr:Adiponectin receptor protein [Strongyloides ratti]CEF60186.1 Adiponectin receptor protein [Strongyloides ratti]
MTICEAPYTEAGQIITDFIKNNNANKLYEKKSSEIIVLNNNIKKKWITWTTIDYDSLPKWYKDNEFLRNGYRPPLYSYTECFKSIFSLHTETGNIWSHLFGCILFCLIFLVERFSHIQFRPSNDQLILANFYFSAVFCFGASSLYHTMISHSCKAMTAFCKIDYAGIAIMNVGGFIPPIYYLFYKNPEIQKFYLTIIITLGIICIFLSLSKKFSETEYRPLRAAVFLTLGCSAFVPILHYWNMNGIDKFVENGFLNLIAMFFIDLIGALFYVTRIPERWFPGKCDYWFQSHQLFHICVLIGAIVHHYCINLMAHNCYKDNICLPQLTSQIINSTINHQEF